MVMIVSEGDVAEEDVMQIDGAWTLPDVLDFRQDPGAIGRHGKSVTGVLVCLKLRNRKATFHSQISGARIPTGGLENFPGGLQY